MKNPSAWTIVYERFEPAQESLTEAICTLGNGYFATRGAAPEALASKIHYPGTYIAGLYNRLPTHISGRTIVNEDLVNCPNWIFLTFKIGDGEWFYPSTSKILSYRQELDMHKGVLIRRLRFQNRRGQRTLIETKRIVNMADPHCGAFQYVVTPENYSDWITVRTMLDGTVLNTGVERYRQLNSKHWKPSSLGSFGKKGIFLSMQTTQSKVEVVQASVIRIFIGSREITPKIRCLMKGKERIGQEFRFFARERHSYDIEKTVMIYTSNDQGIQDAVTTAIKAVQKQPHRFSFLLKTHASVWEKLWDKCDIHIEGDTFSQRVLRLHIFHLLQTASIHNVKIDAALPARGLHGEAYRGHIFWDSIFVMHFYDYHLPEVARALLLYRYRRLPRAREYAKKQGYKGAMFPWQSGSSGREETQVVHLNPMSGKWGPDYSSRQRHVSAAIAYNVWQHWKSTDDFYFLSRFGAELILSIARFFASLAKYDNKDKRYHTRGIMGPDEFHEKYPGSAKPGLKDNAYTNIMIVWILLRAKEILDLLPESQAMKLLNKLGITHKELERWKEITYKMNIIINKEGIISQFDGYFKLKELDWEDYRAEYGDIHRMDRILKAEGKSPDDYKISKQADVLMAFYLLPLPEIKSILERLGYSFDKNTLRKNYEYYIRRTSHGSTLSKVTHCYLSLLLNKPKESRRWFREVLESDIYDTQGGTTPEGIHMGVMGGSIDIVVRSLAGISFFDDKITINPRLPKNWRSIRLKMLYRGIWISFSVTKSQVSIFIEGNLVIPIEVSGKIYYSPSGKKVKIPIKNK